MNNNASELIYSFVVFKEFANVEPNTAHDLLLAETWEDIKAASLANLSKFAVLKIRNIQVVVRVETVEPNRDPAFAFCQTLSEIQTIFF